MRKDKFPFSVVFEAKLLLERATQVSQCIAGGQEARCMLLAQLLFCVGRRGGVLFICQYFVTPDGGKDAHIVLHRPATFCAISSSG